MNSNFLNKYKVVNKIGEGSFSEVLKCENIQTGSAYAAKCLKKTFKNLSEVYQSAEIMAMKKLKKHQNIVYLIEFHYDITKGKVVLIFELMDLSMYEFIKLRHRCFPETKVKHYLYQIVKGLHHLHSNELFHRDIKPENILVKLCHSTTDSTNSISTTAIEQIKLADLGSVRPICSKPPYTEYISTRWYRSPECLLTIGEYGPKMDIWAAGCVFYEMLTLKPLFPGTNEVDQLFKIHQVLGSPSLKTLNKLKKRSRNFTTFPKQSGTGLRQVIRSISEEGLSVLRMMLQYDVDMRTNTARLLNHKFFEPLRSIHVESRDKKIHIGDFHSLSLNSTTVGSNRESKMSSLKCSHGMLQSKTQNDMKTSKLFKPFASPFMNSKIPLRKPLAKDAMTKTMEGCRNNFIKNCLPKTTSKNPKSKTSQHSGSTGKTKKKSKTISNLPNYISPLVDTSATNNKGSKEYESKSFFVADTTLKKFPKSKNKIHSILNPTDDQIGNGLKTKLVRR